MDSGPGDEMLLLAVAERDIGAFRTLYERHAGWLAIRLARRCNDRDLVADAIGDIFVAVWQRPRGFRGDGDIAIADLLRAARRGRGVHPRRAGQPGRRRDADRAGPPPGEATP
jgi:DNA-directed RNA polymerase specialized sigma24 family protein